MSGPRDERKPGERYLVDAEGPRDPEVERLEHLLGRFRYRAAGPPVPRSAVASGSADPPRAPRAPRAPGAGSAPGAPAPAAFLVSPRLLRVGIAAAALFVATMLVVRALVPARGGWTVRGLPGVEHLARGGWLAAESAGVTLDVGEHGRLGRIALEPGTRVRLDDEGRDVHALYLARGALRATITAEPRDFQIGTPAGVSVDLGCVYTLAVDADEASRLAVEWGMVAFEAGGRTVFVPEGYATRAGLGEGPDVPLPLDADAELARLVRRLQRERAVGPEDLALIAALEDSVVLYHLVRARAPEAREAALDALLAREGLPAGRTRAEVLTDDAAWEGWHAELSWAPSLRPRTR